MDLPSLLGLRPAAPRVPKAVGAFASSSSGSFAAARFGLAAQSGHQSMPQLRGQDRTTPLAGRDFAAAAAAAEHAEQRGRAEDAAAAAAALLGATGLVASSSSSRLLGASASATGDSRGGESLNVTRDFAFDRGVGSSARRLLVTDHPRHGVGSGGTALCSERASPSGRRRMLAARGGLSSSDLRVAGQPCRLAKERPIPHHEQVQHDLEVLCKELSDQPRTVVSAIFDEFPVARLKKKRDYMRERRFQKELDALTGAGPRPAAGALTMDAGNAETS
eukprot:TRINITY_DN9698_c0_g1_i2.p1 TRINITY_DN9698_c0_g1~~TRINITY_DN9698_c0_g1_i2.p1  ORF type:complete len:277 (+),score=57.09 TRINITY_DN9698_c0_g1_i2:72-902(+)